ncbi:nucleoside diphosphate kinase [Saccharothrix ecbatanensis]|uniref:Nucleoside diphosphate kinase n=1 Tax=Saccharothrix ecbatanensis TaxID=1105145 RepID=A0A7W9HE27_9PSEU|nr:hypothetical protein [Saccharothrix ecbatanensis]MBB5800266.1 nucleoside diphosphate kinase [Saccharothrix ecbatanensis]
MTSQSYLLIKPEAIECGLRSEIYESVKDAGLNVVCQHEFIAQPRHFELGWSDLRKDLHPLEHVVFELWFAGKPVELLLVETEHHAHQAALLAKARIRNDYSRGAFRNMVHAPDSDFEFRLQLGGFDTGCPRCSAAATRITSDHDTPQAFSGGTLLPEELRNPDVIMEHVAPIWNDPQSYFWSLGTPEPWQVSGPGERAYSTYLRYSPYDLSYDNLVGALLDSFPGMTFGRASELLFSAMNRSDVAIATGTRTDVTLAQRSLMRQGLNLAVRPTRDKAAGDHR